MARVPVVSNQVMTLCRRIHPSNKPCYVEVRPCPYAQKLDCFMNVQTKVNLEGGQIQYGWALWQPSGFFLAAEHHAVYEPKSGPPWVDITPHGSDATRILFLPDEKAVYDMNSDKRQDNIRMALVDDERVLDFFRLCGESNDIWNSVPGFGQKPQGAAAQRLREIEQRQNMLKMKLETAYPLPTLGPNNDPCPCGSPRKYKKCHGKQ